MNLHNKNRNYESMIARIVALSSNSLYTSSNSTCTSRQEQCRTLHSWTINNRGRWWSTNSMKESRISIRVDILSSPAWNCPLSGVWHGLGQTNKVARLCRVRYQQKDGTGSPHQSFALSIYSTRPNSYLIGD